MFRSLTTRGLSKPFAILIAALLALYVVPLTALPASAAEVGGFQIDGNKACTGGALDWDCVDETSKTDLVYSSSDDTFANPVKEDDAHPQVITQSVPAKGDLQEYKVWSRTVGGSTYLYLGWQLAQDCGGSVHVDFELNQSAETWSDTGLPKRSHGDLLVEYDLKQGGPGGGATLTIQHRTWNGTSTSGSWSDPTTVTSNADAAVNGDCTFGEVGLNLTALGIFDPKECDSFAQAWVKTRSSGDSFQSSMQDIVKPAPVTVTNCSAIKIVKKDADGDALSGAVFKVYADGGNAASYDPGVDTVQAGECTTAADGTCTVPNLFPGTYWVVETSAPLGYIGDSTAKKVVVDIGGKVFEVTFTNDLGKAEWEKRDASSGELVCCAVFRVQGTGGAAKDRGFDVTVRDDNDANTALDGQSADDEKDTAGVIRLNNLYTGTYTVSEITAPNGYEVSSPSVKTFTITSTMLNSSLTGTEANSGTAGAFLDVRLTPDVSVVKRDTSADGATLGGAQFELFYDNGTKGALDPADISVAGHGINPQTTGADGLATWTDLVWGDYLVVEQQAPTGYQLPDPKPVRAFSVTRANADDSSRVLTFTDPRKPSTITVTKKDKQGNVITTFPARFGLYVDSNNDGVHQDGEPQVPGTPELNPQWTTTDGTQGATVDGSAGWSGLDFGHYVVRELQAPQGYDLPADRDLDVDIDAANAGGTFTLEMQDPKLKTPLTVRKTDDQGQVLPGATFELWQETNGVAALQTSGSTDTLLGACSTGIDGTCTLPDGSGVFEITWPNTYYWVETAPPSGYSLPAPDQRVKTVVVTQANISDPFPATVFVDPKPEIVTHATAVDLPDGTVTDWADLTGVPSDAAGTLNFALYGPFAATDLKGTSCVDPAKLVTSKDIAVSGPGRYPTGTGVVSGTATSPGTYYWYVTYTSAGDAFGSAVEPCGSPNEVVTVNKAAPVITTQATQTASYLDSEHGTIQDVVTVRPVSQDATGDVVVSVYGPSPSAAPDCSGPALESWTATRGNANTSLRYTVTPVAGKYQIRWTTPALAAPGAGYYFWKATYAGDANNEPATHACGEISETRHEVSSVDRAPVTVSTSATPSSLITPDGTGSISDAVFLEYGGVRPTGTVTVTLYGPLAGESAAQSCATDPQAHLPWQLDLADGTVVSDNTGTYLALTTPEFIPTQAGTYRWAASYSGDTNYQPSAAVCPDPLEVSTVSKPELDKSSNPSTVATAEDGTPTLVLRGSMITYSLTVTNTGAAPVVSKPLVDTLPDQVSFTGVTGSTPLPTQGMDMGGHATLTWLVSLDPGESQTFTYTVVVDLDAPAADLMVNTARFLGLEDTTTHQVGVPVPTLDKSSPNEGATVPLGSTIHYTIEVQNTGNYPITGSPVVDTLPDGVTYVGGSATTATSGGGAASAAPTTGTSGGHTTLSWTVTLPPGATATFDFDVTVDADNPRAAELRNTAAFENLTDVTVHHVGIPGPTLDKFSNPATNDASPTIVQPGTRIDYSVQVGNNGNFPLTDAPVLDTLPEHVSVVAGTISDGGTLSNDGKSITWTVTLAPAASKTLTYSVIVAQAAPQGALLVNTAKFQGLTDTTTHVVPTGDLTLVKAVSPVAGDGVVVEFGDTLTYTLTASATGSLDQPNVVVTDYLPGYDPARPTSGKTTYVPGSANCVGVGTCTVTGPDANGLITWSLGDMAAGTSRQVTFQVVIDDVAGEAGETIAVDILNAGAVKSDLTPLTPSNEVTTPVTKVLGVKIPNEEPPTTQPDTLPHTGALAIGEMGWGATGLLVVGLLLLTASRRRVRPSTR